MRWMTWRAISGRPDRAPAVLAGANGELVGCGGGPRPEPFPAEVQRPSVEHLLVLHHRRVAPDTSAQTDRGGVGGGDGNVDQVPELLQQLLRGNTSRPVVTSLQGRQLTLK